LKALVTGGAGFIASHIVDRLVTDGYDVVVVDNFSSGTKENLSSEARVYEMDIRNPDIAGVFAREKPDMICHHAAQLDVRVSMRAPLLDADINISGSLRLIDLSIRHGVGKIIFASTGGAIYGEECVPASESDTARPISGYGVAKLSVEQYLYCFQVNYGLAYTALRYSNVYGPRQNAHGEAGVVAIFSRKMMAGEPVTIYGDGGQTRDFVFVEDVVEANMAAIRENHVGSCNIGTGIETSVNELYTILSEEIGATRAPQYGPARSGEQRRSVLTCDLARKELGWTPRVDLRAGLSRTVAYFREHGVL
jgi:UDP-glucose 4-epimerase